MDTTICRTCGGAGESFYLELESSVLKPCLSCKGLGHEPMDHTLNLAMKQSLNPKLAMEKAIKALNDHFKKGKK